MRICWFKDNRLGLVEGDRVRDASEALESCPNPLIRPRLRAIR